MTARTEAEPARRETPAGSRLESCGIVIFGASGDLTGRKLLPALYSLFCRRRLPENFYIVGVARRPLGAERFREQMRAAIGEKLDESTWREFARKLDYFSLDANSSEAYQHLRRQLEGLDQQHGVKGNYVFYLAVPPDLYAPIVAGLGAAGLAASEANRRLIVEKPFGSNRETARQLNSLIGHVFHEQQVYRIDHFLGKETVQNVSVLRFANGIFEPLWNRNHIDHVQITVAEDLGVEHRAAFYEKAGAVRDMIQNHLLQVLCLIAMEPPAFFEARYVRQEKLKVLQALQPLDPSRAVRGQYGPGRLQGREVPGYRQEEGIDPRSATETYVAVKFELQNWRWAGVPFYLRTGKRMPGKVSEVSVQFRDAPLHLFACTAMQPCEPNLLRLRIQPDEGICLRVIAKTPGLEVVGRSAELEFDYDAGYEAEAPSAYETLLLDALEDDSMLFSTGDWVEASWGLIDPLLETWAAEPPADFPNYSAGTWGPASADALLARDGRRWHLP